jgi:hypothetical protein
MSAAEFRQALEAGDIAALRGLWATAAPHLPQPASDAQAEIVMHRARTETASITMRARAYSHRWLTERQLPSGLPDALRPKAERLFPIISEGVGIAVKARSPLFRSAAAEIQQAMSDAVADAYAAKRTDPAFLAERMREARDRTAKALFS